MAFDEDQKKCGGIASIGLFTIIISVAMIIIGYLNLDVEQDDPFQGGDCNAEPNIPLFLIVGGILFILVLVLRFVFQRLCRKCANCGDNKICNTCNFACSFSCILIYDVITTVINIIWLVFGSIWTFSIFNSVNFDNESSSDYCPAYTYHFTFWLIIVLWILFVFGTLCGLLAKFCDCFYNIICCKPCQSHGDRQQV